MSDDRKTPTEPVVARERRRNTPQGIEAVNEPPRPDGRYAGVTPSESDRPPSDRPIIAEVPKELDDRHPRMDRAPLEKTWNVPPPELVANSPGLRAIETYSRDGSERARQGRTETRELRAEFQQFKADNAGDHLGIKEKQAETNSRLDAVQKALPDATRAGRRWAFATAAVSVSGTVAVAVFGWLMFHEQRLMEQAKATTPVMAAPVHAHR